MGDDQDFFFDEEDEKPARGAKTPAKPATTASAKGSAKPAAKTPARSPDGTSAREPAAPAPSPEPSGSFFEQNVSVAIASLAVVCALLVGVIAGVLIGQSRASGVADLPSPTAPAGQTGAAAPLTPDQLNSGKLPSGHPSIGATATGTTKPSKTATGK